MKRTFLMILAFVFVIGKTTGAQEVKIGSGTLTFSGKIASGVFYEADDTIQKTQTGTRINTNYLGEEGKVFFYNESDNKTPLRADLTATYINDNIGFRIRLRSDSALNGYDRFLADGAKLSQTNSVLARYAYGWVYLFDDIVKGTAGFIDLSDNVWGTLGDGDWDIGGNGLRLEFKPMKIFNKAFGWEESVTGSLNIGAFFMIPAHEENLNIGKDDEGRPVYRTITLERALKETAIGFRYTHPWLYAGMQLKLDSDMDGVDIYKGVGQTITSAEKVWSGADDEAQLMFGAGFTMLPQVTLAVEGNFEGLGNRKARGKTDLRQTASYTFFDKLTVGLKVQEILWGYDMEEHVDYPFTLSPWIQFKPFINYKITSEFTAGIEAGFGSGHLQIGRLEPTESNTGKSNDKERRFVNEKSNIFIKPNLEYNFTNGLALKLWYKITFITYDNLGDDPMFADLRESEVPKAANNLTLLDSLTKQQIAFEFVWSF